MRNRAHSFQSTVIRLSKEKKTDAGPHLAWKSVIYRLFCFLCFSTILATAFTGAHAANLRQGDGGIQGERSLGKVFPGLELVRCLFLEGRLVVRFKGELTVLHSGDQLPEAGLMFVKASDDRIVLQTIETDSLPSGISLPKAIVVLSRGPDGFAKIQTYRSEPPDEAKPLLVPQSATASAATALNGPGAEAIFHGPSSSGVETESQEAKDEPR